MIVAVTAHQIASTKKPHHTSGLLSNLIAGWTSSGFFSIYLPGDLRHDFVTNVEVGVDLLDVVVLFEGVYET